MVQLAAMGDAVCNVAGLPEPMNSEQDGRQILLRCKIRQETAWPADELVDNLVTSLEGVPLAITQAAAYINRNGMTMADYLRFFQTSESERMSQLSIGLQDSRRKRGFSNSVFQTWRLTFDQIRQRDSAAATLLTFLAFLDMQSIPMTFVQRTQAVEANWRHALGTVMGYTLVVATADETISIHPLLQESVRYWVEQQNEKESCVEHVVQVLAASFPNGEHSNWTVCQTLLPQAQAVLRHQGRGTLSTYNRGHLQYHISWFLLRSGQESTRRQQVEENQKTLEIDIYSARNETERLSEDNASLCSRVRRRHGDWIIIIEG